MRDPKNNFSTRILFYISFMLKGMAAGTLFLRNHFHVVYATSPPFFVGLLGWYLSKVKGGKFVFEVRDLWPRSAAELGELKNKQMIDLAEKVENFYFRKASLVIAVIK